MQKNRIFKINQMPMLFRLGGIFMDPLLIRQVFQIRDVHRGGKSAAAAPPWFEKLDTATLPRRGVMKSETHRTATAPHSNEISPLPRRTATIKKKIYRCRAATAMALKYSLENILLPRIRKYALSNVYELLC